MVTALEKSLAFVVSLTTGTQLLQQQTDSKVRCARIHQSFITTLHARASKKQQHVHYSSTLRALVRCVLDMFPVSVRNWNPRLGSERFSHSSDELNCEKTRLFDVGSCRRTVRGTVVWRTAGQLQERMIFRSLQLNLSHVAMNIMQRVHSVLTVPQGARREVMLETEPSANYERSGLAPSSPPRQRTCPGSCNRHQ